jgi:hypothetical protein
MVGGEPQLHLRRLPSSASRPRGGRFHCPHESTLLYKVLIVKTASGAEEALGYIAVLMPSFGNRQFIG